MQSPTCDRCDIADRIGALVVHVDARRWDQILDLLAPEVDVDYTSLFGGAPQSSTREQLVDGWRRLLPGFTRTTHVIGTPTITVGAHTARASASVVAWHFIKDARGQPDILSGSQRNSGVDVGSVEIVTA